MGAHDPRRILGPLAVLALLGALLVPMGTANPAAAQNGTCSISGGVATYDGSTDAGEDFDLFEAGATGHSWANAYLLSHLSNLVYLDQVGATEANFQQRFCEEVGPLGLDRIRYITDNDFVLPDGTPDTELAVAETDDAIIIVFRGTEGDPTEPEAWVDWMTNATVVPDPGPDDDLGIHGGFSNAAKRVFPRIVSAINASGGKKVWLTGHSLGGALATTTGYYLERGFPAGVDQRPVQGIVTFGAPRVFSTGGFFAPFVPGPAFVGWSDFESDFAAKPLQRWVNDEDFVPHIPPPAGVWPLDYRHVGTLNQINPVPIAGQMDGCTVVFGATERSLSISFSDHSISRYSMRINHLMPNHLRLLLPAPALPKDVTLTCDKPLDRSPPVVSSVVTGTLGNEGWYTSDVSVSWTVHEPDPPFTVTTVGCGPSTVSADTAGTTFTCTATSLGGSRTAQVTVKRDATPPTAVVATPDRAPNANGWYNAPVSVQWSGTDPMSGIASCSQQTWSGPDTAAGSLSGTCTDQAGNTSAPVPFTFRYDATPPTAVVATPDRAPNANGWYNAPVSVQWSGTDAMSGIASCSQQTWSGPDTAAGSLSGTCTDRAGNTSAPVPFGFSYDATPPNIVLSSPVAGADYFLGQAVTASYTCSDALSGLHTCAGPVASGDLLDTSGFGTHQFTVGATDLAGNTASVTREYSVTWALDGFHAPVDMPPAVNVARAGHGVPVKWNLLDAQGEVVPDRPDLFQVGWGPRFACDAAGGSEVEEYASAGQSVLRWDAGAGQYVHNLRSSKADAGWCRYLVLRVGQNASVEALFRFR